MDPVGTIISNLTNMSLQTVQMANQDSLITILLDPYWIMESLVILVIAYVLVRGIDLGLRVFSEQLGTNRHFLAMFIPIVKTAVYLITLYLIFSPFFTLGIAELSVLFGLLGAGLGFGLKDLFADLIAGIIIILQKPYQIGDMITMDNMYGEVMDIGLIQTIIITPSDNRVAIPNYLVITQSVSSANAGSAEMMVVTELFVSYDSNIREAIRLLHETVITSRYVYLSPSRPCTILVENHPLFRKIIAKAYVNDLRNEFVFKTNITVRAWEAFQEAGILPPDISRSGGVLPDSLVHG